MKRVLPVFCLLLASAQAGASEAAIESTVDLMAEGAVCDGRTDDTAAIVRALSRARESRRAVLVPQRTCAHADVLRVDGVTILGSGPASVLHALDWHRSAIFLSGDSPALIALKLTAERAPSRQADWEMTAITVFGGTGFVVDHVIVEGAGAAGIQTADGARLGRISHSIVRDTLSDGIHITGGASAISIESNRIENTGDDGIAVVSYRHDPRRVSNVVARNNVVIDNRFGRNMSVVGGENIVYEHNRLLNNRASLACLYVAQEAVVPTYGVDDVLVAYNTLENCGGARGHAAVMVYSDGEQPTENVRLVRNELLLRGRPGIRVFGSQTRRVVLDSNRVSGGRPDMDVTSPGVVVTKYAGGPAGNRSPRSPLRRSRDIRPIEQVQVRRQACAYPRSLDGQANEQLEGSRKQDSPASPCLRRHA